MKMKIDNLVIGSNLESVIYTCITDSKLLLYGEDFPSPWEKIDDTFTKYLFHSKDSSEFSCVSNKFDSSNNTIVTKSSLYRTLLFYLKLTGKLFYHQCDKFIFADENKLNYYFNNNADPTLIEFRNLYFINFNQKEDELEFLFEEASVPNYLEVYDIFKKNDKSTDNIFEIFCTDLKYPYKYCEYMVNHDAYLMCMFFLTDEEFKSNNYPDSSEILLRKYLFTNPKLFIQNNIQRTFNNFDSNRYRYFKKKCEFRYISTDYIKFENYKLEDLLAEIYKISLTEHMFLKYG